MLQAAVIKYLTRITTTTPMARIFSHKDDKYQRFHPRIFTELGSHFMFVTKEMIIHVLTFLDDTWKQKMNRMVMAELADHFLTELEEEEVSKHMYMLDQTAKPGSNMRNERYVWIKQPTEEELIASLCKKVKKVQMRPEDMERVIKELMFETIQVEQNPLDKEEEDEEFADSSDKEDADYMDLEDKRKQKKVVNKVLIATKDANSDKSKMMPDSGKNGSNNNTFRSSTAKKRQRDEPDQQNVQKKRKTSAGTKRRVNVNLIIKGDNVHGGGKFIAFNIEALKKIRTEFNSKNDTMSYALERVFGDKSFQVYNPQISSALNELGITEKDLLKQPFITGSEGKTINYAIIKKKQEKEYTETVTVNMWRISPVKYFARSDRIAFHVRNRIISSANAALMFGGKPIVNQHMNNKMDVLVMYTEDFDSKAYETNCKLNLVPLLDTRAIVALPPITKKFVVSLVSRDLPVVAKAFNQNPLIYPKSFIASEFYRALLLHVYDPKRNEADKDIAKERLELFKALLSASEKMSKIQVTPSKGEDEGVYIPSQLPKQGAIEKVMHWIDESDNSNNLIKPIDSKDLKDMLDLLPDLMEGSGMSANALDPNNPVAPELMNKVPSIVDDTLVRDSISSGIITPGDFNNLMIQDASIDRENGNKATSVKQKKKTLGTLRTKNCNKK